jgi:hypothetical protein
MTKAEIHQALGAYTAIVGFKMSDKSRLHPVIMRKAAIMTALYHEGMLHDRDVALVFNHERTTVLHHRKHHEGNMIDDYYKHCYSTAVRIIRNIIPDPKVIKGPERSKVIFDRLNEMRSFLQRGNVLRHVSYCDDIENYIKDLEVKTNIQ